MQAWGLMAGALDIFRIAAAVLVDALRRQLQHAVRQRGEEAAAFAIWKPLAEEDDAQAQFWLGQMYDLGRGVGKDFKQAAIWYRRPIEQTETLEAG